MRIGPIHVLLFAHLASAGCRGPNARMSQLPQAVRNPTFTKDIAPILFERCSPCHRPGQPAPFTLVDYSDAQTHARRIAEVAKARFMPPWLPSRGYGEFAHERR